MKFGGDPEARECDLISRYQPPLARGGRGFHTSLHFRYVSLSLSLSRALHVLDLLAARRHAGKGVECEFYGDEDEGNE